MTSPVKIAILGADGRMGRAVASVIERTEGAYLCAAIVAPHSPRASEDGYTSDLRDALNRCDVLIDFSAPKVAIDAALMMHDVKCRALVSGTTGFSASEMAAFDTAGESVAVVQSGNFSLGVNVLTALVEKTARILGQDWDVNVLDVHHRDKVDAPSGTALMLGAAVAKGRGTKLPEKISTNRNGKRKAGEIGFAAKRIGGVIGDHDVSFASMEEGITLSHRAYDRALFAKGAVKAALWAAGQKPGRYDMRGVLGLDNL